MPYGFTQYIAMPIAVIVLVLAQSLIVIVRAWRRHPARATCGRCGYDLSASPTWQCPECGVALKQQGVRAPALRARDAVSLSQVVSAWAVIGLLAYFLGFLGVVGASIGRLATIELIRSTVHPTQVVPKWDGRPEMDVLAWGQVEHELIRVVATREVEPAYPLRGTMGLQVATPAGDSGRLIAAWEGGPEGCPEALVDEAFHKAGLSLTPIQRMYLIGILWTLPMDPEANSPDWQAKGTGGDRVLERSIRFFGFRFHPSIGVHDLALLCALPVAMLAAAGCGLTIRRRSRLIRDA